MLIRHPLNSRGYSLLELMMVVTLGVTLSAAAVPEFLMALDDTRASGAMYHVSGRLQRARMEAVTRSAMVGMKFTQAATGYSYAVYADGNRNGVLSRDIQSGIDRLIVPAERLSDHFPGIEFGAIPGLPAVDPGGTAPGTDPIRLGSADMASFSAMGTSSSGTVYIRSRRDAQYAVRIFGETGKTRMLKYDTRTRLWKQL
jgi:prepilin-type N-terminal cleavage/methylation domain-containing protein